MPGKTILVVVDTAAEHQPVLGRAAWLATGAGADMELFTGAYDCSVETGLGATALARRPAADMLDAQRERLEELANPFRARGLSVAVDVATEFPFEAAIVRKVVASRPWIVAKHTERQDLLQRTLLTSTDWHLIRNCPAPLWLVKPRDIAASPKIIAAVDPVHEYDKPVELDDAIFRFAKSFALAARGEIEVVHAFSLPLGLDLPAEVRDVVLREHREATLAFIETYGISSDKVRLLEGRADECLLRVADERNADFIVMGAVARRGWGRILIGSTAERVLDKLPCDLLIVKPATFAAQSIH